VTCCPSSSCHCPLSERVTAALYQRGDLHYDSGCMMQKPPVLALGRLVGFVPNSNMVVMI
jgi:hypothetical protein